MSRLDPEFLSIDMMHHAIKFQFGLFGGSLTYKVYFRCHCFLLCLYVHLQCLLRLYNLLLTPSSRFLTLLSITSTSLYYGLVRLPTCHTASWPLSACLRLQNKTRWFSQVPTPNTFIHLLRPLTPAGYCIFTFITYNIAGFHA